MSIALRYSPSCGMEKAVIKPHQREREREREREERERAGQCGRRGLRVHIRMECEMRAVLRRYAR